MKRKLTEEFIKEFAKAIQPVLGHHGIRGAKQKSVVSDIAFQLAAMLDGVTDPLLEKYRPLLMFKKGKTVLQAAGDMHEFVIGVLEKEPPDVNDAVDTVNQDALVASVALTRSSGKKHEVNVLRTMLSGKTSFALPLEIALGVRKVEEIGKKVDVGLRMAKMNQSKGPVVSIVLTLYAKGKPKLKRLKYTGDGSLEHLKTTILSKVA